MNEEDEFREWCIAAAQSEEGSASITARNAWNARAVLAKMQEESMQINAYSAGRQDEREELARFLGWAYGKLSRFSYSKQEDALMLDEINLILLGAPS